jgi:hypothetical protein
VKPSTNEIKERPTSDSYYKEEKDLGLPDHTSLHIPDLTEEWGELVVVHPPGHQHLCVVMVECPQFSQATQEAGKMLRVLRLVDLAQLL